MITVRYKGMYINGYLSRDSCYVTDDFGTFSGKTFKSWLAAKQAITKARNAGVQESR